MMAKITTRPDEEVQAEAGLASFGLSGVGSGILHPAKANQFRFVIGSARTITMQTTDLKIDMFDSTVTAHVEHPIGLSKELLAEIKAMAGVGSNWIPDLAMAVEFLDGNDGVAGQIDGFARLISHELILDYSKSGVAIHTLVFKYMPSA
jgi:hypothetical protein